MRFQRSPSWPSPRECDRLNNLIYESNLNPFGIAAYNPNEKVTDFVGRRGELRIMKDQIQIVINHQISRSVRLEGPGGVGKSTLFNYLKESIEEERLAEEPQTDYILRDCDILSTYFQIPDKISEFSDIWKPMLEGLRPGFEKEIGIDISLPEYITFQFIYSFFKNDRENLAKIIWSEENRPKRLDQVELRDIVEPIFSKGKLIVSQIQDYYNAKKRELREQYKIEVRGKLYELKRIDNNIISDLFRVLDEDDPEDFLSLILDCNKNLFPTNDELIEYFNTLMRYYTCITGKQPILLIGIDEAVKADPQNRESYYSNLANLFVKLRNTLNNILFVFISTTEDWAQFEGFLNRYSDLQSQLGEYIYKMVLSQLKVEDMIQVFENRVNRFWENYSSDRNSAVRYYPFTDNLFEYAYRFNLRDLRESIHFLKNMWTQFKTTRFIPKLDTIFECLREVRKFSNQPFNPNTLKKFEWEIIRKAFNDPSRFQNNAERSSCVEKGLEYAWRCFLTESPPSITKVQNNCNITTTHGTRRPDIYLEINGNLGAEYRRNLEFQVKVYDNESSISLRKIESSLDLFEENYTDLLYFIITGNGLKPNAESKVRELESKYPHRIRRPILNEDQKNRLYLLALYQDITNDILGNNIYEDLPIAKDLLKFIIAQPIENLLLEVKRLPYRRVNGYQSWDPAPTSPTPPTQASTPTVQSSIPPTQPTQASTSTVQSSIPPTQPTQAFTPPIQASTPSTQPTQAFTPPIQASTPSTQPTSTTISTSPEWLTKYSGFNIFKNEICALFLYLKTRESGTYRFKFTITTVEKNVIIPNASLSKALFKELVSKMYNEHYLQKEKTSYKLTESGETLYNTIKSENYHC